LINRIAKSGLVINKGKTEVMATESNNIAVTVDDDTLQQVVLGAMITEESVRQT